MSRKLLIKKATRIEGNADINIEVSDGKIQAARFLVQEFRGFERIVKGRRVEHAPHLISRICGLCSCAHQVASFRAIENAINFKTPPTVEHLRNIIIFGEWISSHALSYFFLGLPDSVGAEGGIFEMAGNHPEISNDAFFLRDSGLKICEILGKRAVHPVSMAIGHFQQSPSERDLDRVRKLATDIKKKVRHLIMNIGRTFRSSANITFPEDIQLNYVAIDDHTETQMFKVYSRDGGLMDQFNVASFEESISEIRTNWTLSKIPFLSHLGYPEGIMLVGPLSRSFLENGFLSDPEIKTFELSQHLFKKEILSVESFDICRILEIFWAAKRILELLDKLDLREVGEKPNVKITGHGFGVLEAPRGVLVHSYLIKKGVLEKVRLLVATQFNNAYINLLIKDLAEKYLEGDAITSEGEMLIGRCVRLLDPCLSCATH